MKKILVVFITLMSLVAFSQCGGARKKCVRACGKAAIADLEKCIKMAAGPEKDACTEAAKKKGRECLAACPK